LLPAPATGREALLRKARGRARLESGDGERQGGGHVRVGFRRRARRRRRG
jgi:hypothetical protein